MRRHVTPLVVVMAVGLAVTMLTSAARGQTTSNLEVTSESSLVATSASNSSSEITDGGNTVATATDSQPRATSATTSAASANGAVTIETTMSIQTQSGSVISPVNQSIVTNTLTTTAASVAELKVTEVPNSTAVTEVPNSTAVGATETNDAPSTTSTVPWTTQGAATAIKPATDDALRVHYSTTSYVPSGDQSTTDTDAVTFTSSIQNADTDLTEPTTNRPFTHPFMVSTIANDSASAAIITAALPTVNTTESPATETPAVQVSASATSNLFSSATSGVAAEKLTTGDNAPVNYSSSYRNASTWIAYEATEALASTPPVPESSTDNTSATIGVQPAQHHEIFTTTGGSVSTTSTPLTTAVATATQFSLTISSGANEAAITTNGASSETSSDASSITAAAAASSSAPYSAQAASEQTTSEQTASEQTTNAQMASVSEKAALLTDGASTVASVVISAKTAAPAASSTRFDRLWFSSTASLLHDGATTADASHNSSDATQTPPTQFTKAGSNNTKSTSWTTGPTVGRTVVTLTVVIAAVIFAGAALIACIFILFKCWAALRVCSARKRCCGSYKADDSHGDGRSCPMPVTSAAWRQAREVAAAGANATLGHSVAPTAAGTAADDRLLSLWVRSDIADEASPRHAHSLAAEHTERKLPGMLSEDRPNEQLNGAELLPPLAASPPGVRWPLTTFRGVPADYRAPMTSRTPAYTALNVDDGNSSESSETHSREANQYVVFPGDILARTIL